MAGQHVQHPSGRLPAASAASRNADSGERSDGLRTTELPIASAGAIFQQAISNGKFHGTTAATTPAGSRVTSPSSWAGRRFPVQLVHRFGGPGQAAHHAGQVDTACVAHRLAHIQGFQQRQLIGVLLHQRASASNTRLRCAGLACDQWPASKARRAASTARSTSCASQSATAASTRPSMGLMQSKRRRWRRRCSGHR